MSVAIRVSPATHEELRRLAAERKEPIGQVVAAAVEQLKKEEFWTALAEDYERLYADPAAAAAYEAETTVWDATLQDGLEDEPPYDQQEGR
jgi:predicted transcriptional regulator